MILRPFMLLSLLLCLIFLLAGNPQNFAADPADDIQINDDTWQDPFYTGPFGIRTWTDRTGNHRVKGRFVELLPEQIVRLQRHDGRLVRIPLAELSRADRKLARQIASGNH